MAEHPETLDELFRFYNETVKLLYSSVQVENQLPAEVLFELNAAFDHLSRRWIYGESERDVVHHAYSHLKRSCLDVFKLRVKTAIEEARELYRLEISLIDNGEYERNLKALVQQIKAGATEARRIEGRTKEENDGSIRAFDAWQPVFEDCVKLEKEFYFHPSLNWAKRTDLKHRTKKFVGSIVAAGIAGALLKDPLVWLLKTGWAWLSAWLGQS